MRMTWHVDDDIGQWMKKFTLLTCVDDHMASVMKFC